MIRIIKYLFIFILLGLQINSFSQKQGNNWFFGNHAGVNFNTGTPVAQTGGATTAANNLEGTATISDTAGNLLFYTDGQTVWNRNHATMTNGTGLMGNASATQCAVIVPHPTSLDSFFIFTIDDCQHNLANGLRYSIVKMSASSGLGAVTATKNVLLTPPGVPVAEKITAVKHCNNRDIWVIAHGYGASYGRNFYVYLITPAGINPSPTVSTIGTNHQGCRSAPYNGVGNARGYMKASPDGRKIALAICYDGAADNQDPNSATTGSFELFSFNNTTGDVSSPIKFGPSANYKGAYGIEFSPGGAYLYGSTWGNYNSPRRIYQWNLMAGSPSAIQNSATLIATTSANPGALQLARNGKIYIVKDVSPNGYLDCINNPDNLGTTCNYQNNAVFLLNNRYGLYGLPTFIQSYFNPGFSHNNNFAGKPTSFFISDTTLIDSVFWNFGDPSSGLLNFSKLFHPYHIYYDTGYFNIMLILYKCNTTDTLRSRIYIYPVPIADFRINDSTQCFSVHNVVFTNTSHINGGTITGYLWRFGDGDTSTKTNPSHYYLAPGVYTVWLVVTSNLGAKDSIQKRVFIDPEPDAGYTVNDDIQCQNENSFIFTNTSTILTGSMNYTWYFGDGDTSHQANPIHHYLGIGDFIVKLVVSSLNGCKDSLGMQMRIYNSPTSIFDINDSVQCLNGNNFIFSNLSTIQTGSMAWNWQFGDLGTSNSYNPSHKYNLADTFTVTLICVSNNNCTDTFHRTAYILPSPRSGFSVNDSTQCLRNNNFVFSNTTTISRGSFSHKWYFSDGDTSSVTSPSHSFLLYGIYQVRLVAISGLGCSDSVIHTMTVYPMPKADFSISDSDQCFVGNNFILTNNSTIPNGAFGIIWDFGDKISSNQVNPSHSYALYGTYTIKLTASSALGCIDSLKKNVVVYAAPKADFSVDDSNQCFNGNSFKFINKSTVSLGSMTFDWNLRDGTHLTSSDSFIHQYLNYGVYNVTLKAFGTIGCNDSIKKNIFVNPMPVADFDINNPVQCQGGNNFIFTNYSTIPYGSMNYYWKFGDACNASGLNTSHSYGTFGNYNVWMTATSQSGCKDSASRQVTVNPVPDAHFSYSLACLEDTTHFSNTSTIALPDQITNWLWNFGDGNTSAFENPTNVYMSPGLFQVRLTVISNNLCRDSMITMVRVNPHISANELRRASIDNDPDITIEWEPSAQGIPRDYVLERSTDNAVFYYVSTSPNGKTQFVDKTMSVGTTSFIYRMKVVDSCDYTSPYSNTGKTILLGSEENTLHPVLHWTPYTYWSSGVKEYQVEVYENNKKAFIPVGTVVGDTSFSDNSTHLNQSEYCYRVIAVRNDGIQSISNTYCVKTPFELYVPDAFSPDNDMLNDTFFVKGKYVFGFHIVIFNRWGEKIYESDNIDKGWDGKYKNTMCETGYYFYRINAWGTKGQGANIDGTILLLR